MRAEVEVLWKCPSYCGDQISVSNVWKPSAVRLVWIFRRPVSWGYWLAEIISWTVCVSFQPTFYVWLRCRNPLAGKVNVTMWSYVVQSMLLFPLAGREQGILCFSRALNIESLQNDRPQTVSSVSIYLDFFHDGGYFLVFFFSSFFTDRRHGWSRISSFFLLPSEAFESTMAPSYPIHHPLLPRGWQKPWQARGVQGLKGKGEE